MYCDSCAKLLADLKAAQEELEIAILQKNNVFDENERLRKALEDAVNWLCASELFAVKPLISDLKRALNTQEGW